MEVNKSKLNFKQNYFPPPSAPHLTILVEIENCCPEKFSHSMFLKMHKKGGWGHKLYYSPENINNV